MIRPAGLHWLNWAISQITLVNMGSRKTMLSFQFYPLPPDITFGSRMVGKADDHSAPDIVTIYWHNSNLFRLPQSLQTQSFQNNQAHRQTWLVMIKLINIWEGKMPSTWTDVESKCVKLVQFCFSFFQPQWILLCSRISQPAQCKKVRTLMYYSYNVHHRIFFSLNKLQPFLLECGIWDN